MKYQVFDVDYLKNIHEIAQNKKDLNLMYKGIKYGYFLFVIIIILSAFFNGNIVLAQSNNVNYTFQENELFNESNPISDFNLNYENRTVYTNDYNATFSHTDEVGDTGTNILWVIGLINTPSAEVFSESDGHKDIVRIEADAGWEGVYDHFIDQTVGSVEFWIRPLQTDQRIYLALKDGSGWSGYPRVHTEFDTFGNIEVEGVDVMSYSANTWYLIRWEFDVNDDWHLWINDISIDGGSGYGFGGAITEIDYFYVMPLASAGVEIDAIGYTFYGYDLGTMKFPYSYQNNSLQVDNWSFLNNENGNIVSHAQQDIPFWSETGVINDVYIKNDIDNCIDDYGVFFQVDSVSSLGIEREFSESTYQVLEVEFIFDNEDYSLHDKLYEYFDIYSYDDTLITRIRIDDDTVKNDYRLSYYDGGSYNELEDLNDNLEITYVLNIVLHHTFVRLSLNDSIYDFPFITNKDGLGKIHVHANQNASTTSSLFLIDSIAVYINGISLSNDFGSNYYSINTPYSSKNHNLFFLEASGFCGMSIVNLGLSAGTISLFSYQNSSFISLINTYDEIELNTNQDPYIVISTNTTFSIESMILTGVLLSDGINDYYPIYSNSSIMTNESYYYVSDNNLYFTMTTDDSLLEYIDIQFDIINVQTANYSLSWSGIKSSSSLEAEFNINYDDGNYNYFTLSSSYFSGSTILPNDRTIDSFSLLISDNGNNINHTISGYFGSFILLYYPDLTISYINISLLDALPIIVLVVVIPLALYVGFGRKKQLLVPSIIAMSIFGSVVGIIPLWLTFVILFGCFSYYLIDKKVGG